MPGTNFNKVSTIHITTALLSDGPLYSMEQTIKGAVWSKLLLHYGVKDRNVSGHLAPKSKAHLLVRELI